MTERQRHAPAARASDSERDDLTATLSRPAFVAALKARAESASRDVHPFGLCIVDIDHFKNINLSHGPTCGDDALRDVAQRLVRTISATTHDGHGACVGRYDGGAFAVIVEARSARRLAEQAEALRLAVEAQHAPSGSRMSASVGAVLARIGEPVDTLLVRAEQTLYLAKQFGRNRVELGPSPVSVTDGGVLLPIRKSA